MSGGYVFRVELSNPGHPEYGVATVPFPIPKEEYEHILELLEPLEIGDPIRRDCGVSELDSFYTVLDRMSSPVNLDELDYLAKRLDSFCDQEAAQFQAMAAKLNLTDMTDLINLTFCCQQATVITDFSNLEQIGKDHYMILQGGCCSTRELEEVDGVETAMLLISDNKGEVTPYGVVYDNGMKLEQLYDGVHFPEYHYEPNPLTIEVVDKNWNGVFALCLPVHEQQIERLLLRFGFRNADADYTVTGNDLPPAVAAVIEREESTIQALNQMCVSLSRLDQKDLQKLDATVELARPSFVGEIEQLIKNLDLFEFAPGVKDTESYGRYMIQESGRFEYDPNLEEFYDYRRYGQQKLDGETGRFTEAGYISYHGEISLDELLLQDPVTQVRSGQIFQMGGLS